MINDVLQFASEKLSQGEQVALVTITKTSGSSPASEGQMIAVCVDSSSKGTVGGGNTEFKIISEAVDAIKSGKKIFSFSYDHSENGMVCGGSMSGVCNIIGNETKLYIFGGGHIAQSLAKVSLITGFSVVVIEDRPEFSEFFQDVNYITAVPKEYENKIKIPDDSYIVICTRGHMTDYEALCFSIEKKPKYLGVIGSSKKVEALYESLEKDGIDKNKLKNIYTPIGLDIASSSPSEIAVSILAEILLIKNKGSLNHKRILDI